MTSIQLLLICLIVLSAMVSSIAFQSQLTYRIMAVLFMIASTFFVLFPDAATVCARVLGVGRGADLLLYLSIFAGVHCFLLVYLRLRNLDQKVTSQIRALAIHQGQSLPGPTHPEDVNLR
jgi:hypothetical protein